MKSLVIVFSSILTSVGFAAPTLQAQILSDSYCTYYSTITGNFILNLESDDGRKTENLEVSFFDVIQQKWTAEQTLNIDVQGPLKFSLNVSERGSKSLKKIRLKWSFEQSTGVELTQIYEGVLPDRISCKPSDPYSDVELNLL